jgi:P63C domain
VVDERKRRQRRRLPDQGVTEALLHCRDACTDFDSMLAAWAKTFPNEFYEQIFRLRGWQWKGGSTNPPQAVAGYTKDFVYARLAPGLLKSSKERTLPLVADVRPNITNG